VRDISDARMSGTSYDSCILHVVPESNVGGLLALIRTGDLVTVNVAAGRIRLEVSESELLSDALRFNWRQRDMSAATAGCPVATSNRPIRATILIFLRRHSDAPPLEPDIH
jgi:dihydroxy-acid dehydratase